MVGEHCRVAGGIDSLVDISIYWNWQLLCQEGIFRKACLWICLNMAVESTKYL